MTEPLILVPFGDRYIALARPDLLEGLARADAVVRAATSSPPSHSGSDPQELVDANRLEALTGIDASWWSAAARRGDVPHFKIGRYVRFRPSEVLDPEFLRGLRGPRHADQHSAADRPTRAPKPRRNAATPVLQQLRGSKGSGGRT